MAKLTRYTQKVFGSTSGANSMARFGDLAASYPTVPALYSGFNITPALVQALSNYLTGWPGAVVGGNSPAIEDMNALCYLFGYQLTYLMQEGIPEWDSGTTYYIGSLVNDGTGIVYRSIANSNTNNAVTDNTKWTQTINGTSPTIQKFTSGTGTYTKPANVKYIRVTMIGGGGGGAGAGSSGQTPGDNGGDTTFGTTLLSAGGGTGGSGSVGPGGGGSSSLGSGPIGLALSGGSGFPPGSTSSYVSGPAFSGGNGASSPLGSGGFGGAGSVNGSGGNVRAGNDGVANTGTGGGGGAQNISGGVVAGAGGGAGGYIYAIIQTPLATYAYGVGASGASGSAGTSGSIGGAGGSGLILVEEFYQ